MIPKIIHYCWFGEGKLPRRERKCMSSWESKLSGYTIKRWDESNFNIDEYPFAREAYDLGLYAFVADVARMHALYYEGGIYLDTDIELLKPLDSLLSHSLFLGFETDNRIQTGVIGSEKNNPIIGELLNYYKSKSGFIREVDAKIANSEIFANIFQKRGYSTDNITRHYQDVSLYSSDYFCPINQITWEIRTTPETYCIHYLSGSWMPKEASIKRQLKHITGKIFGYWVINLLRKIAGKE